MHKLKQLKNQYFQDSHQRDKKLFFLVAMPRSGNTLFSTVMSQNPKIAATANSITLEIIKDLFLLKQTDVFQNFPDHKSLDNVLDSVFDTYYKDWSQKIIIDRGPVMTPNNFALMQKHYKRPFKCIVLLRDLMDVKPMLGIQSLNYRKVIGKKTNVDVSRKKIITNKILK